MEQQPLLLRAQGGATDVDPHLSAEGCSDDDGDESKNNPQLEHDGSKDDEQQQKQQQQQQQLKHEPTTQEYTACQISTWYPAFSKPQTSSADYISHGRPNRRRRTKGITFKSVTLDILAGYPLQRKALYNYLLSDGIQIPPNTQPSSLLGLSSNNHHHDNNDNDNNDMDAWSSSSSSSSSSSGAHDDVVEHETCSNREVEGGENNNKNSTVHNNNNKKKNDDPAAGDNDGIMSLSLLDSLTLRIEAVIQELGGSVMPKLNWSAPKDAIWINQGSLCCKSAADVYLLLKSSDFVASDLQLLLALEQQEHQQQQQNQQQEEQESPPPPQLQLTLRKWCTLYESQEFRCFVKNHELIGISQRNADLYFEHLCQERDNIRNIISDFFYEYVQYRYPTTTTTTTTTTIGNHDCSNIGSSNTNTTTTEDDDDEDGGGISNYVLDVYVDRYERVWIMDFNVWGERTDSILFDWNELHAWETTQTSAAGTSLVKASGADEKEDNNIEIRAVETDRHVLPDPLNNYRAPVDTVHLAALTGGSPDKFQAFMDMCERPSSSNGSSSSSSSSDEDIS